MKEKILVFGGTFNPIHNGHLIIAHRIAEQMNLNNTWLMPNKIPPHKDNEISTSHKRKMMEMVGINDPFFHISFYELDKDTTSYTIDTVRELNKKYNVHWLIGPDILTKLYKWHKIDDLAKECKFIVAINTDNALSLLSRMIAPFTNNPKTRELLELPPLKPREDKKPHDASWYTTQEPWKNYDFYKYLDYEIFKIPFLEIRGVEIRERAKQRLSIKYMVPHYIENYIKENQLYMK